MQADVIIRQAHQEDGVAIATIARKVGWFEPISNESRTEAVRQVTERLVQSLREGTHSVLVAEDTQRAIVGYVSVHWFPHLARGIDGYISELFLLPGTTGRGIGGKLLDEVKEQAVKRGCTRLLLLNRRVRESYKRGFYAKHGWEELLDASFFTYGLPLEREV